jgi:hypothetical protein
VAVTTQDQLVSAIAASAPNANRLPYAKTALAGTFAAGQFVSLWTAAGQPGVGAVPAAFGSSGTVPTNATAGAVPFVNPGSGNSYLARLFATSSVPGTLVLYDRLWACSALLATATSQTIVTPAALTRPDANGVNAEIWIEATVAIGTTASNASCTYTNQAAVTGHVTSPVIPMVTSAPIGWAVQLPLAAGDTGVQTIQTMTLSAAMSAGQFNLVIQRRIAEFAIPAAWLSFPPQDPFWSGLPQIYNSACIGAYFLIGSGTAAPAIPSASLVIAQG